MTTTPIHNLTDVWNDVATTFNAIKMNVTDTASADASKLFLLQVGGVDKVAIDKSGAFQASLFAIADNADRTKKVQFQVSGVTTGNTRVLTVPDFDGTIATLAGTETFTNKTIDSANNTLTLDLSEGTLTGTTAEFNTALSDDSFATLTNAVTLTNKTINLTSNTLTGTLAEFNTALSDENFVSIGGAETLTNKTLTSPVLNGTLSGDAFLDEDNMASDSATKLASQQSIKAYVDNRTADYAVDTIAALKALASGTVSNGAIILVRGYAAKSDGGERYVKYDSGSSATANDVTVFTPDTLAGRFLHLGAVYPEHAGAFESAADNLTALQRLADANVDCDFRGSTYAFTTKTGGQSYCVLLPAAFTAHWYNGTIDVSGGETSDVETIRGVGASFSAGYELTADASAESNAVSVSTGDGANFSAGDIALIVSPERWHADDNNRASEYCYIESESSGTLTLRRNLLDTYDISNKGFAYSSLSGTFTVGETVTGGTSSATGVVLSDDGVDGMCVNVTSGTFQAAEGITGGTSSATATISSIESVRIHKWNSVLSPKFTDFHIEGAGGASSTQWGFRLFNSIGARFRNVSSNGLRRRFMQLNWDLFTDADNTRCDGADESGLGYGIAAIGSWGGSYGRINGNRTRHLFTSNAASSATVSGAPAYVLSRECAIGHCHGVDAMGSLIDTHPGCVDFVFAGCSGSMNNTVSQDAVTMEGSRITVGPCNVSGLSANGLLSQTKGCGDANRKNFHIYGKMVFSNEGASSSGAILVENKGGASLPLHYLEIDGLVLEGDRGLTLDPDAGDIEHVVLKSCFIDARNIGGTSQNGILIDSYADYRVKKVSIFGGEIGGAYSAGNTFPLKVDASAWYNGRVADADFAAGKLRFGTIIDLFGVRLSNSNDNLLVDVHDALVRFHGCEFQGGAAGEIFQINATTSSTCPVGTVLIDGEGDLQVEASSGVIDVIPGASVKIEGEGSASDTIFTINICQDILDNNNGGYSVLYNRSWAPKVTLAPRTTGQNITLQHIVGAAPSTATLTYNTLSGTFQAAESVTGGTSGATATINSDNGSSSMVVSGISGIFVIGETLTGGTSGATSTSTDYDRPVSDDGTTFGRIVTREGQDVVLSEVADQIEVQLNSDVAGGTANGQWVMKASSFQDMRAATATDILSKNSRVNNSRRKRGGWQVRDTTNNRVMVASGSTPTSLWYVADGSASVTPV